MKQRIRTPDEVEWLLRHTRRFRGGQVTDLHVQKRRLLDEESGREVTAGTVLTAIIRYELTSLETPVPQVITRVAKLAMFGVTDFSVFEQEGSDCSEIGVIHVEVAEGRLRFWFDPQGELYVICDEAELDEISMPGAGRPVPQGITDWTFQAPQGQIPAVSWLLEHLDHAGIPCSWRAAKKPAPAHPAWRWEGHLLPAGGQRPGQAGLLHVQTYGPLDGCEFGVVLRACDPNEAAMRLLLVVAEIITGHYQGTCLASGQLWERDEWCGALGPASAVWWENTSRRTDGVS